MYSESFLERLAQPVVFSIEKIPGMAQTRTIPGMIIVGSAVLKRWTFAFPESGYALSAFAL